MNRDKNEPKKKVVRRRLPLNLTITPALKEAMEAYREATGKGGSTVVGALLEEFLQKHGYLNPDGSAKKK
jgi:hypothetical protein